MEKLEIILSLAGAALGLFITTVTFLSKLIKNVKAKKAAENMLTIANAILSYIEEAENFFSYSGEEKKAYVMTKANQFAIDSGIKFDSVKTGEAIEEIIKLTNKVNSDKKSSSKQVLQIQNTSIETEIPPKVIISKQGSRLSADLNGYAK